MLLPPGTKLYQSYGIKGFIQFRGRQRCYITGGNGLKINASHSTPAKRIISPQRLRAKYTPCTNPQFALGVFHSCGKLFETSFLFAKCFHISNQFYAPIINKYCPRPKCSCIYSFPPLSNHTLNCIILDICAFIMHFNVKIF